MKTNDEQPKRPRGRPRKPVDPNAPPPRPRGRPPKSEDDRKTFLLVLRLTHDEHQHWREVAADAKSPLTIFIRDAVRKEIRRRERGK